MSEQNLVTDETRDDILAAVAYCHLGSSQAKRPFADTSFREALALGLLAHDPIWRATERGIGALIAAGLMEGEATPDKVTLHILWARHGEEDVCASFPQFVAAYPDGLVDAWHEHYLAERKKAEEEYIDMVGDNGRVAEFFITVIETPRPALQEVTTSV
jgi:hypothetical protein